MADDKIRTIDNLPIETSIQWEKSHANFDENLISESGQVEHNVGLDTFDNTLQSNVSRLFELDKQNHLWGDIPPPPLYNSQTGRLFTHQLAPSLGPEDRIESTVVRIEGHKQQFLENLAEDPRSAEGKRKISDVEKETDALQSMLDEITTINKGIEYISGERSRFKKG